MAIDTFSARRRAANAAFRGQLYAKGQLRTTYSATIPHTTPLEALLEPKYWWGVSARMKPFDEIECVWECGSRVTVLRVMGKDEKQQRLLVVVASDHRFETPEPPPGYSFEFINADAGWRILQDGRRSYLATGFATALEAMQWLNADSSVNLRSEPAEKKSASKVAERAKQLKPTPDKAAPAEAEA